MFDIFFAMCYNKLAGDRPSRACFQTYKMRVWKHTLERRAKLMQNLLAYIQKAIRRFFTPELMRLVIHFAVITITGLVMEKRPTSEALASFLSAVFLQFLSSAVFL